MNYPVETMRPDSTELISFAIDINGEKYLKKLNVRVTSVDGIIKDLIDEHHLEGEIIEYGLRLSHKKNRRCTLVYITDANKDTLIQDGCEIKLVEGPRVYLGAIFMKLFSKDSRKSGFDVLSGELNDNTILSLIIELEWHNDIIKKLTSDESLTDFEASVLFKLVFKLLRRKLITNIGKEVIETALKYLKTSRRGDCLYATILLLKQSLILEQHLDLIVKKICIKKDLMWILTFNESTLQCSILSFINYMVILSDQQTRIEIIRVMNLEHCKKIIFESVINVDRKISLDLEKELHMYQLHILGLLEENAKKMVDVRDTHNTELNYLKEDMSTYMNQNKFSRTISTIEGEIQVPIKLIEDPVDIRWTQCEDMQECLALLFDDDSGTYNTGDRNTVLSKWLSSSTLATNIDDIEAAKMEFEDLASRISTYSILETGGEISQLTLECLVYFKSAYPQSFYISLLEENSHLPGFYVTSQRICELLLKELLSEKKSKDTHYCPLLFESFGKSFFPEIFCRMIWLILKTRIEMKARTAEDQKKVLMVLKAQISRILNTKPKSYKHLMAAMKTFSYSTISIIWKRERRLKWKYILSSNPNVQEISREIEPEILALIKENRFQSMKLGTKFVRYERDKKGKPQSIYMSLAPNQQQLFLREWNHQLEIGSFQVSSIDISDIKYLVTGNACLHVKEHRVKKPEQAFSLLLDDLAYDFEALMDTEYNTWIDGLNNLIGKEMCSSAFVKEKSDLMEIQLMLRLLDVENVTLPKEPPPVPAPPPNFDFALICESPC